MTTGRRERERERKMLERIEVRESAIHGKGVFARSHLHEGQLIGHFEGDQTTQNGTYVLWLAGDDGEEIGVRGRNALRFLNHGDQANAEFRDTELYATENVRPGSELLIDYGEDCSEAYAEDAGEDGDDGWDDERDEMWKIE